MLSYLELCNATDYCKLSTENCFDNVSLSIREETGIFFGIFFVLKARELEKDVTVQTGVHYKH